MREELKRGQRVAAWATLITIGLALAKGIAGTLTGSMLLIADAIHSGADILAIFASWFGIWISNRTPTKRFPYGFYKAENLATLLISVLFFLGAYEILNTSFHKIFNASDMAIPLLALIVAGASSVISYFIAFYEGRVGREINSQSLIANAQESLFDVVSSLVVFLGILLAVFKIPYVEGAIGILLGLLILKVAFSNARLSVYSLMDASLNKELEHAIAKQIRKEVKKVKSVRLRQSGPFVFGEADIGVGKQLSVQRAYELSKRLEQRVKKAHPEVEEFLIYIEPHTLSHQVLIIPVDENLGLSSKLMGHFGRSKWFLFADIKKGKLKSFHVEKNPSHKKSLEPGWQQLNGF